MVRIININNKIVPAVNQTIDDFELTLEDIAKIDRMDMDKNQIIEIQSLEEVNRLYNIHFIQ